MIQTIKTWFATSTSFAHDLLITVGLLASLRLIYIVCAVFDGPTTGDE